MVATSVLNGRYGYGTTESRAMVDFYGLNANESYTAVLVKAAMTDIGGGLGSIGGETLGGVAASGVNTTWDNLKAGAATSGYVLSAGINVFTHPRPRACFWVARLIGRLYLINAGHLCLSIGSLDEYGPQTPFH